MDFSTTTAGGTLFSPSFRSPELFSQKDLPDQTGLLLWPTFRSEKVDFGNRFRWGFYHPLHLKKIRWILNIFVDHGIPRIA
jgi:hypothetical protein